VASTLSTHAEVRAQLLDAYAAEYKDLLDSWRLIETKSQGAIAISGIFLAAAFSYAKDLKAETVILSRLPLVISILLLLYGVYTAVRALVIISAPRLPAGSAVEAMAAPLFRTAEAGLATYSDKFVNDQLEVWRETNAKLADCVVAKAGYVRRCHWSLLLAAAFFVLYTFAVVISRSTNV
jgi:hypothetical protein